MAILGHGTKLKLGDGGAPENFTDIPKARDFRGPSRTANLLETTDHDSPGGYIERIQGLKDPGSITFDLNYDPALAQHQELEDLFNSGAVRNYRLHWSNGVSVHGFAGIVSGWESSAPVNGQLSVTVTITITGQVTRIA